MSAFVVTLVATGSSLLLTPGAGTILLSSGTNSGNNADVELNITEALVPGWWGLLGGPHVTLLIWDAGETAQESPEVQAGCQLEVAVSELTEMVVEWGPPSSVPVLCL